MVHGRFQPFHRGHLAYLEAAAARCPRLLVGITSPDRAHLAPEAEDGARHLPASNPFTYTERLLMVSAAAEEAGIDVRVIPFPIGLPELWPDYVPAGTTHFLRVLSPWGAAKRDRLRAAGQRVVEIDAPEGKGISGARVREAMRAGEAWEELVPPAVAAVLRTLPPR
jgi:cytidyltransferase-like protein